MNKNELVISIADSCDIAKSKVKDIVNEVFDTIKEAIKEDQDVDIYGFGKFSTTKRSARKGRNPSNGKPVDIPAKTGIKFKASKTFKDEVNC